MEMQETQNQYVDAPGAGLADPSALVGYVIKSLTEAKDQRVFVHMVNLYNTGAFTLPGLAKPLNECTMEEVLLGEQEEERQCWREQQRQGNFIALTRENILEPAMLKAEKELTVADFMLAKKQVDKAQLIVFEGRDGQRYVLKDTKGAVATETV